MQHVLVLDKSLALAWTPRAGRDDLVRLAVEIRAVLKLEARLATAIYLSNPSLLLEGDVLELDWIVRGTHPVRVGELVQRVRHARGGTVHGVG